MASSAGGDFGLGPVTKCGVGVLLVKRGPTQEVQVPEPLVLVGRRRGSHGAGTYSLPGGHLEFGESFQACGAREVLEETGIDLSEQHIEFAFATSDMIDGSKHYVTIFMRADVPWDTEAKLLEPHKCEGWLWVPYSQIPEPRFPPISSLLSSVYKVS